MLFGYTCFLIPHPEVCNFTRKSRQKASARGRRQRRTGRCQSPAMENPAGLRTPALWQLEDAEDPALAQGRVALRCF